MILPDVNILVHAFRTDSPAHGICRNWLENIVSSDGRYGMSPQVLSGVIRITTHPKIFVVPSTLNEVLHFCDILLDQPHCVAIYPAERHWEIFKRLCSQGDARGNLAMDAWFAAVAIESGCEWITLDHDYARFPGLKWRHPG
jgi:uncharacterized protein